MNRGAGWAVRSKLDQLAVDTVVVPGERDCCRAESRGGWLGWPSGGMAS